MHLASLLFGANLLIFTAVISHSAAEEDEDGEVIDWGSSGCVEDGDCLEGECCVKKENGETDCERLRGIGEPCSQPAENKTLPERCPCKEGFSCSDKSDGVVICERPKYQHF
uniref:Putative toxin-like peptide n=1 Tax=Amblyomma americanum TaxID=6943 RepID=A0A0C9R4B8_AMBAM